MKSINRILPAVAGLVLFSAAAHGADPQAGAADYNCKTKAVEIQPQKDTVQSATLVREWQENAKGWAWKTIIDEKGKEILVEDYPIGGWKDQDAKSVSNYYAVCWLKFKLTKGKDYVFSLPEQAGYTYEFQKTTNSTYLARLAFGSKKTSADGYVHYYVRSSDWVSYDVETAEFCLRISGGLNLTGDVIGRKVSYMFQQRSVNDLLPSVLGSDKNPHPLDVTHSGQTQVEAPVKTPEGKEYTAYKVILKAGVQYVFYGAYEATSGTSGQYRMVYFNYPEGVTPADIQKVGELSIDLDTVRQCGRMKVKVTEDDYPLVFRIVNYNLDSGSVQGMTLSWEISGDPRPDPEEPVSAGVYAGVLPDADGRGMNLEFSLKAFVYENGGTNFCGTLRANGAKVDFASEGKGSVTGSTVIAGISYPLTFVAKLLADDVVHVDGSVHLDVGAKTEEFFFRGDLNGDQIVWAESLLQYDPENDSAAKMGITAPDFKDEPKGTKRLSDLHNWAVSNNIRLPMVNSLSFDETGDPLNLISEAYLLDCAASVKAVEQEAAKFIITSFDIVNGPVIAGKFKDGNEYANGHVQVRTANKVDGKYDASDKGNVPQLFYRASLIK